MSAYSSSRRRFLVAGGAASAVLLMPRVALGGPQERYQRPDRSAPARGPAAGAADAPPLPAASVGFLDSLEAPRAGATVAPARTVAADTALRGSLLSVSVSGVHPAADDAFPRAYLDALFADAAGASYPFYAYTHGGGPSRARMPYTALADEHGLRFVLSAHGAQRAVDLGWGTGHGLRSGTYLLGLGEATWDDRTTLTSDPAQQSVVVVVRAA